jgi:hypothetical protein
MAITRGDAQITWSSASSITLSNANRQDSDPFTFDPTDVAAVLQLSADNNSTPSPGDVVRVYLKLTTGDILGDTGDDYDTNEHAFYLGTLDTVAANTPGEDPARMTVSLNEFIGAKGFVVSAEAPQGGSRSIVVRARVAYQRAA